MKSFTQISRLPDNTSGTLHERLLFNVCMLLLSCYGAMILSGWGHSNGVPDALIYGTSVTANESMWFKILSQWLFILMQFKALHVAYTDPANNP